MQLSPEHYQSSKQFILDFAKLNIKQLQYKVNRGVYANIPTTEGPVKFKANDMFTFHFKDDKIISFVFDEKKYEPTWSQLKLNEWKDKNFRHINPFNEE